MRLVVLVWGFEVEGLVRALGIVGIEQSPQGEARVLVIFQISFSMANSPILARSSIFSARCCASTSQGLGSEGLSALTKEALSPASNLRHSEIVTPGLLGRQWSYP